VLTLVAGAEHLLAFRQRALDQRPRRRRQVALERCVIVASHQKQQRNHRHGCLVGFRPSTNECPLADDLDDLGRYFREVLIDLMRASSRNGTRSFRTDLH
jgi:hypothetical protein